MKFSLFSVAVKNLKRKSFRTAVLIVSIGLLVSILVFGASFILSVGSSIEKASNRLGADLLVVPSGAVDVASDVLLASKIKVFYMDKDIIQKVEKVKGVGKLTWETYLASAPGQCCSIPPAEIVAFNQKTDFIVTPWLRKSLHRKLKRNEALIGYTSNKNLGLLNVDSTMFNIKFKFVGVLEKTGTGLDNAIFISDKDLKNIITSSSMAKVKPNQISAIFVKVRKGYDPKIVARDIMNDIMQVDVIQRANIGKRMLSTLGDINKIFLITIVMASVLSIFLTWTIFSAIVNERFREIGIMKAIGAKGSHIVKLFVMEVLLLGLIGSLAGTAFGMYLSALLSKSFVLLRNLSATLTLAQRVDICVLGLVVGVGICIVGALSSIIRIKKLEPLSVLKEV
ncbi:MAG: FtsX-like permease family protein [Candidatus Sulfobium sp.]